MIHNFWKASYVGLACIQFKNALGKIYAQPIRSSSVSGLVWIQDSRYTYITLPWSCTVFPWIKAQAFISFPVSKTQCLNEEAFSWYQAFIFCNTQTLQLIIKTGIYSEVAFIQGDTVIKHLKHTIFNCFTSFSFKLRLGLQICYCLMIPSPFIFFL